MGTGTQVLIPQASYIGSQIPLLFPPGWDCPGLAQYSGAGSQYNAALRPEIQHNLGPIRRKAGYRPELAWTCCDYADALLQRNGDGDQAKAITLLDESLAISSDLGMRPLMERVLSRREILGA